jgi:uncharacterized protein (DUF952 family)
MTEHESCDSVTIGSGELEHRPPEPGPEMIYKLCSTSDWAVCEREGRLPWSEADRRDGFVHLSTAHQLPGTAQRHFRGREHLVVLEVDPERLPVGALRWETSRGGDRFPHLYAELPRGAIVRALPAPLAEDGAVQLPTLGPTDRPTARVVLLNDRDQVLLLRGDMGVWFMPGGGLEPARPTSKRRHASCGRKHHIGSRRWVPGYGHDGTCGRHPGVSLCVPSSASSWSERRRSPLAGPARTTPSVTASRMCGGGPSGRSPRRLPKYSRRADSEPYSHPCWPTTLQTSRSTSTRSRSGTSAVAAYCDTPRTRVAMQPRWSSRFCRVRRPPCCSTMSRARTSPIPWPAFLVVNNGVKTLSPAARPTP